jgi:hypothetical protein
MAKLRSSTWVLVAFVVLAALAMFHKRRWKPLEVFDADPGGYYAPLPSVFIYHNLARADSLVALKKASRPNGHINIGLVALPRGGYIAKYPLGVALADLPWFLGGHWYAGVSGYPQNGFSRPYQQIISIAGLVHAALGMLVLARLLRRYFNDQVTAWTLAAIGLGTNLLYYASLESGMAHAPLFLWQAALLYCTARWYETPRSRWMLGIGLFMGLAVLTRPTEILFGSVPLLWGITSVAAAVARPAWLWQRRGQVLAAGVVVAAIVSLQLFFWKAATGHWYFYTYGNERFIFARPHLLEGLFSFRKGWLLYTPIAGVALLGLLGLRRLMAAAWLPVLCTTAIVVYVTFSWQEWWYGSGFSARPLISLYPLLALSLASLIQHSRLTTRWTLLRPVLVLLILLNLWQTRQFSAGVISGEHNTAERYVSKFFSSRP